MWGRGGGLLVLAAVAVDVVQTSLCKYDYENKTGYLPTYFPPYLPPSLPTYLSTYLPTYLPTDAHLQDCHEAPVSLTY